MAGLIALVRKAATTTERERAIKSLGGTYAQVRPVAWGKGAGYSHDGYSVPTTDEDDCETKRELLKALVKDDGVVLDGSDFDSDVDTLSSVGLQFK